jgi:hypothetical protein
VPSGSDFIAIPSSPMLIAIAANVASVGPSFVKPSDSFM